MGSPSMFETLFSPVHQPGSGLGLAMVCADEKVQFPCAIKITCVTKDLCKTSGADKKSGGKDGKIRETECALVRIDPQEHVLKKIGISLTGYKSYLDLEEVTSPDIAVLQDISYDFGELLAEEWNDTAALHSHSPNSDSTGNLAGKNRSNCHNNDEGNGTESNNATLEKNHFNFQLEKVKENVNLTMCENERKPENSLYCSSMGSALNFLKFLGVNGTPTETFLKDSVNSFEKLFDNHSLWDINIKKNFVKILPLVMKGISSVALLTALASPERQPHTVVRNSTVIQTNLISPESFAKNETLKLEAQGDQMAIHPRAVAATTTDPVAVAFVSYSGLESLLEEALLQNETLLDNEMLMNVHVNSRLVSASTSSSIRNISIPVNLTFQHLKIRVAHQRGICVHWNSGALSRRGCQELFSNITHSGCSCRYLSNFALLMATTHKQGDPILSIISYLGLSISVICLFLCIVTFLFCRSSHNSSTFIHLQLSLCLFFADLLFITGIDQTDHKVLQNLEEGVILCSPERYLITSECVSYLV
ncbi:adhesion G protein-coupled receptor E3-like [Candoia aspera]|uniref:adhesion G protein-coupled receptor E3-like n=1 Tax=Candoia aspera TaxID=51853 RepID=UPI002FD7EF79